MQVGGNDADDGVDLNTFSKNNVTLLNSISEDNRHIIVTGLLPRTSVDFKPYNGKLKDICVENEIEFIYNYDCFLLAPGEKSSSFFHQDKLHINVHGTRRFLSGINKILPVTKYTSGSYKLKPQQGRHMNNISPPLRKGRHMSQIFCHICSKSDHCTQDCLVNRRNTPRRDVNAW